MTSRRPAAAGLAYSPYVTGKHTFRVRERHVAEHVAPLISSNAAGAAKLDLVLRGIALLPAHAGNKRPPGLVLPRITYERLHDLCRPASAYLTTVPEDEFPDTATLEAKRTWVGEQLLRLEELNLVRREPRPGRRPYIFVLRDDGSGNLFDDPDGKPGNSYVTLSGSIVARYFPFWGAPELAAYMAAMVAERYERGRAPGMPLGGGTWYQPLRWFADEAGERPAGHVRIPFSTRTLERGFTALRKDGLVVVTRTMRRPGGGRFTQVRSVYTNRFDTVDLATTAAAAAAATPSRA